ncbi:MAG: glucokinase [Gammaproteobacteria bacterium]|nr:glucokinase [Gammaproteobacteria bacterium]
MPETLVLLADIGATNARFQIGLGSKLVGELMLLPTADFEDVHSLLQVVASWVTDQGFELSRFDHGLFAVAGPTQASGTIEVTNTGLVFSPQDGEQVLGFAVYLVNDFYAQAWAVPNFTDLHSLGGGLGGGQPRVGVKALLGPGTGLGMATLVPRIHQQNNIVSWQVLASEGGHADLAPGSHLEIELWSLLSQAHGHVSWETVLCGSGLRNLYSVMCTTWGTSSQPLSAADIVDLGRDMEDPVCHQTLETFCGMLGSAAGNLALTVGAVGGIYIGGGIVPRMLEFIDASPFRRRFEERGLLADYAKEIPSYVVLDENPGLMGALQCSLNLDRLNQKPR